MDHMGTDVPEGKDVHTGRFLPGHQHARKKGVAKIAKDVKEGIIHGAASYGRDGTGAGGMPGYFEMCAALYPKEYMSLLGKLLPLQVKTNSTTLSAFIGDVIINAVPSGQYLSEDRIKELNPVQRPTVVVENETDVDEEDVA
jgi:hypothetical protein